MTETFRGAILAVPPGQLEAGQAFGMSRWQVFREILLPQTIRYALPGFGNNWLVLLKTTALLSVHRPGRRAAQGEPGGRRHPPAVHLLPRGGPDLPAAHQPSRPCCSTGPSGAPSGPTSGRPMDFSIIARQSGALLPGPVDDRLAGRSSLVMGLLPVGPAGGRAHLDATRCINWPVWAYTYFFRGTPLLVQLFLIYYGLGQFEAVQDSFVLAAAQAGVVLRAARLHPQHRRLHHRDPARRHRGHARGRDRGRQGVRDVAVADAAPDHPAQRLPPRPAGLRQRGDLHAARQCRGQRGDDPRPHRRRPAGPVALLRPLRGVHHRRRCSTWS